MSAPGRVRRLSLSRPSTGRVLAAGALALAVSAPVLEPVHVPAEARTPAAAAPAAVVTATLEVRAHARVASRAAARRSAARPAATAVSAAQRQISTVRRQLAERRELARRQALARAHRAALARRAAVARREARLEALAQRRAAEGRVVRQRGAGQHAVGRHAVSRHAVGQRAKHRTRRAAPAGMASVIAFAQAQVGKRYSPGGEGPHSFDCSGFTKRAYALAGIHLPHSSGAQAARARTIPRSEARPGDLVVGSGHVGIYMGRGMMIDAGNRRVGVVYRKLYAGLHIERF